MIPVEVNRDLHFRLTHGLGNNQYLLSLQLKCGDDVQSRILEPFQQGKLPSCLYRSSLEYAVIAVRESLAEEDEHQAWASRPAPAIRNRPGNATATPAGLGEEYLALEEQAWPRTFNLDGHATDSCGPMLWYACDFLLRYRPSFFRTIGTLEESYLKTLHEKQVGRTSALSQLQNCQSIEMEKVRQQAEHDETDGQNVHDLVAQHVSEIDAFELHWQTDIEQLKVRQRTTYCEYIVDFFEQEMRQFVHESKVDQNRAFDAKSLLDSIEDIGPDLPATPIIENRSHEEPSPLRELGYSQDRAGLEGVSRPQGFAEVRAVFGQRRVFFVLRVWTGDVIDFALPSPAAEKEDDNGLLAVDSDGLGLQLPPELLGLSSYAYSCFATSSGLPIPCESPPVQADVGEKESNIESDCVFRSPSMLFWRPPRPLPSTRLSPNAYSNQLQGILFPVSGKDPSQSVLLREFRARCGRVTDLHLPPFSAQLNHVAQLTRDSPLRCGDYFCTRHSNLGGSVQVAFHLLSNSGDAHATDEVSPAVHRALTRIVRNCHTCNVSRLTMPLLLLDTGAAESSLPYAAAQRKAENVLRALKGALTQLADELSPSEAPALHLLDLVLPASCSQRISAGMPCVAEATTTFLQHSFQCV